MCSLLDNQTFKKKLTYARIDDDEKTVSFTISVPCNHDIDKQVLTDIELVINDLFLKDYESQESINERKRDEKLAEKLLKLEEKQRKLHYAQKVNITLFSALFSSTEALFFSSSLYINLALLAAFMH
ncbi:MAG: hypothetical protein EOO43_16810, partial [Flavobacterium sp.]